MRRVSVVSRGFGGTGVASFCAYRAIVPFSREGRKYFCNPECGVANGDALFTGTKREVLTLFLVL